MSGGANFMVECLRQAIDDVGKLLARLSEPMVLPKRLILAMDNCPTENKVRKPISLCFAYAYLDLFNYLWL